jgi:citrate lyase alpha subunit
MHKVPHLLARAMQDVRWLAARPNFRGVDASQGIMTPGSARRRMCQTGAGGVSIATSMYVKSLMSERRVQGGFGAGGVTGYLVDMLEAGLFRTVFDVQCFDLKAVESYRNDRRHQAMSASLYANPHNRGPWLTNSTRCFSAQRRSTSTSTST